MSLDEAELFLGNGTSQQLAQIPQAPGAVSQGQLAGLVDVGSRVLLGQREQSLEHAQALGAALLVERLGPSARALAQEPAAAQDPVGAAFNEGAFVVVDMGRVGAELARFGLHENGDGLHALVEQAHAPSNKPCPLPRSRRGGPSEEPP